MKRYNSVLLPNLSGVSSWLRTLFKNKTVQSLGILVIGITIGLVAHDRVFGGKSSPTLDDVSSSSGQQHAPTTEKQQQLAQYQLESQVKRIDTNIKIAKLLVQRDLRNEKLNQAQADMLNKKLDEIKQYYKSLDIKKDDAQEQLDKKIHEWKQWLRDNDLSNKYISRLDN